MGEYQELLKKRFGHLEDKQDKLDLKWLGIIPVEEGFEKEMIQWLKEHPDADLQETLAYESGFLTPIEIVDDDQIPEEERNPAVYDDE